MRTTEMNFRIKVSDSAGRLGRVDISVNEDTGQGGLAPRIFTSAHRAALYLSERLARARESLEWKEGEPLPEPVAAAD